MKDYDYSALNGRITDEDINAHAGGVPHNKASKQLRAIGLFAVLLCVMVVLIGSVTSLASGRYDTLHFLSSIALGSATLLIPVLGVFGLIALIMRLSGKNKERFTRISMFAQANALVFSHDIEPTGMRGLLFDNGDSRMVTESLSFPQGFEIGNYTFSTGSGKGRHVNEFVYARVALNRPLPNMVLDSKANDFIGMSNLPDVFHSSQRLELEGDFNKYFNLYVPTQYERDALYIFTPDVMQMLIESGRRFDIEIVDDELYIYEAGRIDLSSESRLKLMLGTIDVIASELKDQTKRYSDERVVATGVPVVAKQGRRLKPGINGVITIIVIAIFSFNFITSVLPRETAGPLGSMVTFVIGIAIVYVLVKELRKPK